MKFVIIGRTATGKSLLAQNLACNGLKILETYTTRPKRHPDEAGMKFITPAESAQIPTDQKLLPTTQNGHEYFTTLADLEACDVCVLDPDGFRELTLVLPEESLQVIHCVCADSMTQKIMAVDRAEDPAGEAAIFAQRQTDEDAMFSKWEKDLANRTTFSRNSLTLHNFENDYKNDSMAHFTAYIMAVHRRFQNILEIVRQCLDMGHFHPSDKPGYIDVSYNDPAPHVESLPLEHFAEISMMNAHNLAALMCAWLNHDQPLTECEDLIQTRLADESLCDQDFIDEIQKTEDEQAALDAEDKHDMDFADQAAEYAAETVS